MGQGEGPRAHLYIIKGKKKKHHKKNRRKLLTNNKTLG